jgi:hypothetical protein
MKVGDAEPDSTFRELFKPLGDISSSLDPSEARRRFLEAVSTLDSDSARIPDDEPSPR